MYLLLYCKRGYFDKWSNKCSDTGDGTVFLMKTRETCCLASLYNRSGKMRRKQSQWSYMEYWNTSKMRDRPQNKNEKKNPDQRHGWVQVTWLHMEVVNLQMLHVYYEHRSGTVYTWSNLCTNNKINYWLHMVQKKKLSTLVAYTAKLVVHEIHGQFLSF